MTHTAYESKSCSPVETGRAHHMFKHASKGREGKAQQLHDFRQVCSGLIVGRSRKWDVESVFSRESQTIEAMTEYSGVD